MVPGMARELTSDEHLDYIAALLDDIFQIPGTKIRFGLDALIGWIPGIGDAMAGTASFLIVFASWRRGARTVTLMRMIANVLLETVVGAIPVAGDIFHVVWKANQTELSLADAGAAATGNSHRPRLGVFDDHVGDGDCCSGNSDWNFDLDIAVASC